jgi:hypothetical protein
MTAGLAAVPAPTMMTSGRERGEAGGANRGEQFASERGARFAITWSRGTGRRRETWTIAPLSAPATAEIRG